MAPPGSQLAAALGGAPTEVLEETYRIARSRAPAMPDGADARSRLARIRAQAADRAAEDATVALFTFLRDQHRIPAQQLPAHGRGRAGVPLPKREALYGYAAVWEAIQAAEQGRELPALAHEVLTARQARREPTPPILASASRRRGGSARAPEISVEVGGQRCTVVGSAGDTFLGVVSALKQAFGLNGQHFKTAGPKDKYWHIPGAAADVARRLAAAGLALHDASGQPVAPVPAAPPAPAPPVPGDRAPPLAAREPLLRDIANGTVPYGGPLGSPLAGALEAEAGRIVYGTPDADARPAGGGRALPGGPLERGPLRPDRRGAGLRPGPADRPGSAALPGLPAVDGPGPARLPEPRRAARRAGDAARADQRRVGARRCSARPACAAWLAAPATPPASAA